MINDKDLEFVFVKLAKAELISHVPALKEIRVYGLTDQDFYNLQKLVGDFRFKNTPKQDAKEDVEDLPSGETTEYTELNEDAFGIVARSTVLSEKD